jgi:histidinol-phosphate aminotransferase
MTVRLRPMLSNLPGYVPGRSVPGAIKLASNETPYPPLPSVLKAMFSAAEDGNRYPDNWSSELAARLARRHNVPAERIAVGCGSVALAHQLFNIALDAGDEVIYAWRSFETYPIATAISAAVSVQVPLREQTHDVAAMAGRLSDRTQMVIVCNPNNPTGTAVRDGALRQLLATVPADVLVVLDEAYREYVTDPDVTDGITLLDEFPNVVVLRTFSKAYGLAGLRIGYAVAGDVAVTNALRQVQIPFAVTKLAQAAALASLEPEADAELSARVGELVRERDRVRIALIEAGYAIPDTQANFVWVPMGDRSTDWATGCEDRRVVVRPFQGAGVRVTIGTPDENDRFLEAARELTSIIPR